jgi:UDP-3-O-[3-hydroxymyristoyl] glucosamine N-acyltransferase
MIKFELHFSEVQNLLNCDKEYDLLFSGLATLDEEIDHSLIFVKKIDRDNELKIKSLDGCLIVTQSKGSFDFPHCIVEDNRLALAKVLNFISEKLPKPNKAGISSLAIVSQDVVIGKNVIVEDFVFVGPDVCIGDNSIIKQGAKILRNVKIGKNCVIRENAVVGGQGFGVVKDENGNNLKMAQLGGVIIGDHVEVGALNTIVTGTIKPTIIEDYVKIDDHVHVAHNCHIKRNSIITAGVILSGSAIIGDNVWIGPNSTIMNSATIADNTFIGIGTLITKDINTPGHTYAGVPGKDFEQFLKEKKAVSFISENRSAIEDLLKYKINEVGKDE